MAGGRGEGYRDTETWFTKASPKSRKDLPEFQSQLGAQVSHIASRSLCLSVKGPRNRHYLWFLF